VKLVHNAAVIPIAARSGRIPALYLEQAQRCMAALKTDPLGRNLSRGGFDDHEHADGKALNLRCIATALMFFDLGPVRINRTLHKRGPSSYGLKHAAESWGRELGLEPYIANGDLIAAALYRRVPIKRFPWGGPNCLVAVRVLR
jgi:hypothetical protein